MEEQTTSNMVAFVSLTLSNANDVVRTSIMRDFPVNDRNEFTCGSWSVSGREDFLLPSLSPTLYPALPLFYVKKTKTIRFTSF